MKVLDISHKKTKELLAEIELDDERYNKLMKRKNPSQILENAIRQGIDELRKEILCEKCGSPIDDKDIMLRVAKCESLVGRPLLYLDDAKRFFPLCHDCWMKQIIKDKSLK
jgi:hypothetical protein